jgi:hypothetical protein
LVTNWQTVQLCKALLCIRLAYGFISDALQSKQIPEDAILEACVRWSAGWLKPHWEVVIGKRLTQYGNPDLNVTLYPIRESDMSRQTVYFHGRFSDLLEDDSVIVRDSKALDPDGHLVAVCLIAAGRYGDNATIVDDEDVDYGECGLVSIEYEDEQLEQKARFNDRVLLGLILHSGLGSPI